MALAERINSLPIDRLPPQNPEAEECVLGSILMDEDARDRLGDLKPEDFYRDRNGAIFAAMQSLWARNEPVDFTTLMDQLQRAGRLAEVGGIAYLSHLVEVVPTAVHVEHYAGIVQRTATKRRLISAAGRIAAIAYDDAVEVEDALTRSADELAGVNKGLQADDVWTPERLAMAMDAHIAAVVEGKATRLMTGLDVHRRKQGIHGYGPGELVVLGAVSGAGKTSWLLSEAADLQRQGYRGHFASSEMAALELVKRLCAMELGRCWFEVEEDLRDEVRRSFIWARLAQATGRVYGILPHVYDDGEMTVERIRRRVARQQATIGCDYVMVDYLQRLSADRPKRDRYQQVDETAKALKTMAKALSIPVIVAAQFNLQRIEARPLSERAPRDGDFRESGGIYNEADVVLGIHRPSRWDDTADATVADLYVLKNRVGQSEPTPCFKMRWLAERTLFCNPA